MENVKIRLGMSSLTLARLTLGQTQDPLRGIQQPAILAPQLAYPGESYPLTVKGKLKKFILCLIGGDFSLFCWFSSI